MAKIWLGDGLFFDTSSLFEDHILATLIDSLSDGDNRRVARVPSRQERHEAALKVLSITSKFPAKGLEIQDLSRILHQSRTSLFNGCKEQFSMSPIQVIRSVRMHQVRHALLDVEFCEQHNLSGVIDGVFTPVPARACHHDSRLTRSGHWILTVLATGPP